MNVIGDAYVDIHARDRNFEKEVRKMVKDLKVDIKIVPKVLTGEANKTIRAFTKRNADRKVEITANLNTTAADKKLERLVERYDRKQINLRVAVNNDASKILQQIRDTASRQLKLNLNTDNALKSVKELKGAIVQASSGHVAEIKAVIDTKAVEKTISLAATNRSADVVANADTASAEAALDLAARDRVSNIRANIGRDMEQVLRSRTRRAFQVFTGGGNPIANIFRDPEVADAITGFGNSVSGAIPLRAIKSKVTGVIANFESIVTSTAKIGSLVGATTATLAQGIGSSLVMVKDISQVIGGMAALPAIIATTQAAMGAVKIAWSGMSDALSLDPKKSAEAMANLIPKARATAVVLRDVKKAVFEATQTSYWDALGDSVIKASNAVKGPLTAGMSQVAVAMAYNTSAIADSIKGFANVGDLKSTFDDISMGLRNAVQGSNDFTDSLLTLTREGAKRIPQLGDWFSDAGEKFNSFIQQSAETGAIVGWIDTAVYRLKELGDLLGSTVSILGSVGTAAYAAGAGGLTEFTDRFQKLAEGMKQPAVMSGMKSFFRATNVATEELGEGFGKLFESIGKVSPQIGGILVTTSEATSAILSNFGSMLSDSKLTAGATDFFRGVRDGILAMEPAFIRYGDMLGDLGTIGGELFRNMAPGLNMLFDLVASTVENLKDGFLAVNPVLNHFIEVLIGAISGPIKGFGTLIGGVLTAISKIPVPVMGAVTALLAFKSAFGAISKLSLGVGLLGSILGVKNALGTGSGGLSKAALAAQAVLGAFALKSGGAFGKMKDGFTKSAGQLGSGVKNATAGAVGAVRGMTTGMVSAAALAAGAFKTSEKLTDKSAGGMKKFGQSVQGMGQLAAGGAGLVRTAFSGLGGLIAANLPLAIIGAAAGVFMHFQNIAQQSKMAVSNLSGEFDALNGTFSDQGAKIYSDRIGEIGNTFSNSMGWSSNTAETFERVGVSIDDVKKNLKGSVAEVRDYGGSWKEVNDRWNDFSKNSGDFEMLPFLDKLKKEDPQIVANMGAEFDKLYDSASRGEQIDSTKFLDTLGRAGGELHAASLEAKTLQETLTNVGDFLPQSFFDSAEKGGKSTQVMRDALIQSDAMAGNLKTNFTVLASSASSVAEKLSAFQSNQSILGLDTFKDTAGLKEYYEGLDQIPSKYDEIRKAVDLNAASAKKNNQPIVEMKDLFKDLDPGKGIDFGFDLQIPAARQLHSLIGEQADLIDTRIVGSYDDAIKGGKNFAEAQKAALDTSKELVGPLTETGKLIGNLKDYGEDTFIGSLRDNAKMSAPEIESLVASMGLIPKDIKTALNVDGADNAIRQMVQAQVAGAAFASGDYSAVLSVMDEDVRAKIGETLKLGENFNTQEFKAKLQADTGLADTELSALMLKITSATDPGQARNIIIDAMTNDAVSKLDAIKNKTTDLTQGELALEISAETGQAQSDINTILAKAKELGIPVQQTIDVLYSGDDAKGKMDALRKAAHEKIDQEITTKTTGKGKEEVEALKAKAREKVEQTITQKTVPPADLPKPKPVEVPMIFKQPEQTPDFRSILMPPAVETKVNVAVNGVDQLDTVKATLASLPAQTAVNLSANSNVQDVIAPIPGLLGAIGDKSVNVTASSNAADVIAPIPGLLGSLADKGFSVNAIDNASGVLANVTAQTTGLADKQFLVTANSTDAVSKVQSLISTSIPTKTSLITGNNSQALGAISAVNAASVSNKSFTITTIRRTVDENSSGGMYMGGVQTFASGGVSKVQKAIERHKRIGGHENRVAQIAKGSQNYRVWGETETQGEAYIPLAASKRARSLKILKQVMDKFGIEPGQSFANGGYLGGTRISDGVTSFASGGVSGAEKRLKKAEKRYKDIDNKKANAKRKKAAQLEVNAAKKKLEEAKKQADITKTMNQDIRDFTKSLTNGLDSTFNRNRGSEGQKAIYSLRDEAKTFISSFKKTRPKEAKRMETFNKELLKQSKSSGVWNKRVYDINKKGQKVGKGKIVSRNVNEVSSQIANDAQKRQKAGKTAFNAKYTARDYERALEYTGKSLEKAQSKLENLVESHKSQIANISGGLFSNFNLGSLLQSSDGFGYRPPTTARDISSYSSKMLSDMKKFKGNIEKMRKAGYNQALIADISQMGLEEGLAVSGALLADKSQLKTLNSDYTQLFGAKGQYNVNSLGESYVGGLAQSIGKYSADMMYGAGKSIQEGLVKGLTDDVKALEKAGQVLSDTLVAKFKKILGIKSPSRVFMALGKFIPKGLAIGIDSQKKVIDKSVGNLVTPSKLNLSSSASGNYSNGVSSDIIDNRSNTQSPINLTINPQPGMSDEQIGKSAARELMFRMDSMTV